MSAHKHEAVGEQARTRVRHAHADVNVEMLEGGASGGDRLEPGVCHVLAAGEVDGLEVGAAGGDRGDRREPGVCHVRAAGEVDMLEVGASGDDRREPCREPGVSPDVELGELVNS